MQFYFYLATLFSIAVAIFAIQNSQLIAIKFFFWQLPETPLAIIILAAALAGAVAAFMFGLTGYLKNIKERKEMKEQIKTLHTELAKYQESNEDEPCKEHAEKEPLTDTAIQAQEETR